MSELSSCLTEANKLELVPPQCMQRPANSSKCLHFDETKFSIPTYTRSPRR